MIFAQITDIHLENKSDKLQHLNPYRKTTTILDDVNQRGLKNLIITGDIAESAESVKWFLQELKRRELNPLFSFGNHDVELTRFYDDFKIGNKLYFEKNIEGNKCLFLDSSKEELDREQITWFKNLTRDYNERLFIFIHHPVFDCGTAFMDRQYPLREREEFQKVLMEKKNEIIIFCGHYHMIHEQQINNVKQYVSPATLYQISPECENFNITDDPGGYRIIEITRSEYKTHIIKSF